MSDEVIWLISIAPEFEEACPLAARRGLESAKRKCDEQRKLYVTEDYSIGPITWGDENSIGEVIGEATITYTFHGKTQTMKQMYVLGRINLED